MTDFAPSLDLIARLVKQFRTNLAAYHAPEYKEADARQELIDPLFVALGWDVHNEQHVAPQYREVIPEQSLDVEGQKKAPDYAFRQYTTTRFFVEAKKARCGDQDRCRPGLSVAPLCVERQAAIFAPHRL